ncbi:MAG: enoyl-CoA hydratase/isomerase family protein [Polyangiaceae bacterium]|nr:enoyl-CoA hydratase/isomerase family protein [Polyangiaceae bacterium]
MSYETLRVERDGGVAVVTVNRPEKLNALNATVLRELEAAVAALAAGPEPARCVVLTGAGEKAFVAGADIAAMSAMTVAEARAFSEAGHRVGFALERAPFPVLAAVNGFALGGGLELALACDFIYASDRARVGQPEVNLGLVPGFGGTQRLARRVGIARARELIYSGDPIDAARALAIGLVNEVVPHGDLQSRARARAAELAAKAPLAIATAKRALLCGPETDLPTACELEATSFAALFASEDTREGTRAFLEKRPPTFRGV